MRPYHMVTCTWQHIFMILVSIWFEKTFTCYNFEVFYMCNTVGAHVHLSLLLHEGCFGYFTLLWRRHPNLNSCFIKHGQHLLFLVHSCMVIGLCDCLCDPEFWSGVTGMLLALLLPWCVLSFGLLEAGSAWTVSNWGTGICIYLNFVYI